GRLRALVRADLPREPDLRPALQGERLLDHRLRGQPDRRDGRRRARVQLPRARLSEPPARDRVPVRLRALRRPQVPRRSRAGTGAGYAAAAAFFPGSTWRRYCPVNDSSTSATSSGVPVAITSPPASPPSGPRSISQSACLIT